MNNDIETARLRRLSPHPLRALAYLLAGACLVIGLHLASGIAFMLTDSDWADDLFEFFSLGFEDNLPTFYSSALWMGAAFVSWSLWRVDWDSGYSARWWLGLAGICTFMAFDEAVAVHERLNAPLRATMGADGLLFFAWTIPYSLLVLGIVATLGRFIWRLGRPVNLLIIGAGALFVSGALLLELLESQIASETPEGVRPSYSYIALYTVEESLEILGVTVFVYALLLRLRSTVETCRGGRDRADAADR